MPEHPRHKLLALATLLVFTCLLSAPFHAPSSAQEGDEERAAIYQKFLDNYSGGVEQQRVAYDAAREYLRKYSDHDEAGRYVKKWAGKYKEALAAWKKEKGKIERYQRIYDTQDTDPRKTHKLVKEFLKKYPDDAWYAPSLRRWLQSYEGGAGASPVKIPKVPGGGMGPAGGMGRGAAGAERGGADGV